MNKSDLKRDHYMLKGPLAKKGYDWWWHSLTAYNKKTGEPRPFFIDASVGSKTALLCFSADSYLGNQKRKAEGQRENQINQQKQSAAVLGGEVREPPDIAQSDRRTRGGKDKSDGTRK